MTEFYPPGPRLPCIPNDLTIPQFFLDGHHPTKPVYAERGPWFIEDATGREIGFEEIRTRVYGLANEFKDRWNLGEDDVVCLFSPNHVDWPIVLWATHRLGGIVTPTNPGYTTDELVHTLQLSNASMLVAHSASLAVATEAARIVGLPLDRIVLIDAPAVQGGHQSVPSLIAMGLSKHQVFTERRLSLGEGKTKIALLCFSSGTTGKPKAVAVPHYAMIANVIQGALAIGRAPRYEARDVVLGVLPFFHVFGLVVVMHMHLYLGSTIVVVPRFVFENFLQSIQRYRVKHLPVVPPMVVLLCKHPLAKKFDLSSVRWLMSGAAPLSAEITQHIANALPLCAIVQGYGMTETFTTISLSPSDQRIATPGSAGVLIPGVVARVVKPDGSLAKEGESGELVVTGPSMSLGYYKNPEATKETFVNGWVRTGDEVIINAKSEIFILDRIKEILKVKGFQVAPAELEGHLLDHPDVADSCVVGVADEYSGEIPLAFVVLSASALERVKKDSSEKEKIRGALIKHVSDTKVDYKRLAGGVEFIDSIPKNPSGKLLRRVLREKAKEMRRTSSTAKARL